MIIAPQEVFMGTLHRITSALNHRKKAASTIPHPWRIGQKHVLIVEDDREIAAFLAQGLHAEGYETQLAGDGVQALRFFDRTSTIPDLILLDLWMPRMNGLELLRRNHEA